jgi:DNA-binding transcriptional LysR family regulator
MEESMPWTDRIGRRVKLRDLHILLAVAQTSSMARAANHLGVSQPVVSKTLSDLEHALGVRLFDRNAQGIEPTTYGRAFVKCGAVVFDELRRGVQELEFLSDPTIGTVRIGGAAPFIDELIPTVITRLAKRCPRLEFHVAEGDTPSLCRLLRERKLDLVIGRIASSMFGDDLASEPLFEDAMRVVAGLESPWSRRRKIELAELRGEPWAMPEPDNLAWVLINEGFHSAGVVPPAAQVVSNSMAVRTRLVETGRFLTMLPSSTLHFGAARLRMKILPIAIRTSNQSVQIITLKNRTPNPIAKVFIDELHGFAEPLPRKKAMPSKTRQVIDDGPSDR